MSLGRTRTLVFAVIAAVLLVAVALAGTASVAATHATPQGSAVSDGPVDPAHDAPIAQTDVEADAVSLRADLRADGSAAWQVAYRVELDDENATAAFEELRADIEADPEPYLTRFGDRMNRTVRAAENATGREMSVSNLSVSASRESLPQGEYGVVVYRLDWAGFAASDGDRLRAGDAIDRFFLDARTSLTVAWPDAYGLSSVEPDATSIADGSVTWQGRRDFGPGEPRVEVVRGAPPGDGGSPGDAGGLPVVPIAVVLAILLAAGLWLAVQRRGDGAETDPDEGGDGGRPVDGGVDDSVAAADADGPPAELLSNEERVIALLEQHGGRMKQQQVAAELDWTDAKTSQVVGDLRDAGDMQSFRLGRENVLTLPDVSVEPGADEDGE